MCVCVWVQQVPKAYFINCEHLVFCKLKAKVDARSKFFITAANYCLIVNSFSKVLCTLYLKFEILTHYNTANTFCAHTFTYIQNFWTYSVFIITYVFQNLRKNLCTTRINLIFFFVYRKVWLLSVKFSKAHMLSTSVL